ncbi:sialidase-3 [Phaethornis superciliosus]
MSGVTKQHGEEGGGDGGSGVTPPASPPPGSLRVFLRETLFRQGEGITYRIPALLYLPPTSTFLSFAEKRSSPRDEDAKFLVMRRGHHQGSWVEWGPVEELSSLVLPGHRTMNPCPLYEASSGTVFLFFICVDQNQTEHHQIWGGRNAARLCCSSTSDGGFSWTPPQDLTAQTIGPDLSRWATFAVGPGHGVQLSSGRLVVPAYAYRLRRWLLGLKAPPCCTQPHSLVFYSDDAGRHWRKGAQLGGHPTGECQVAEISGVDGRRPRLYCNARSPRGCRAVAFSPDEGSSFGRPKPCKALRETPRGCQGSVVSFTAPAGAGGDPVWLLYSHPTDERRRKDLGIYLNPTPEDGEGWERPWVLHSGPAGYSDLAVCPEGVFGCLFECGTTQPCQEICFCLFSLDRSQFPQVFQRFEG